jgi:NTE family protein
MVHAIRISLKGNFIMTEQKHPYDKIVYLLQGGGALGSYQAGVCQALLENDCAPDWVVGTSIGAINAAIIAGNQPQHRAEKLHEFWDSITYPFFNLINVEDNLLLQEFQNYFNSQLIALYGLPNFFKPRLINPLFFSQNTPDKISFYDTSELQETLKSFIDFDLINQKKIRLTLGAVRIKGGEAVRFDNFNQIIGPEHIMASSALPPGFPAIKIDGEYYWDGGLSSNTPLAVILEEQIPQKLLCFIVNLFSYPENIPTSLMDVMKYKKEIEFASRHQQVLHSFCELHYLQNTLHILSKTITDNHDLNEAIKRIKNIGHPTSLNIILFHYKDRLSNLCSKDYNFSRQAINEHWRIGYHDAKKAFEKPAWRDLLVGESGAMIHEF